LLHQHTILTHSMIHTPAVLDGSTDRLTDLLHQHTILTHSMMTNAETRSNNATYDVHCS